MNSLRLDVADEALINGVREGKVNARVEGERESADNGVVVLQTCS